ncbi:MAG: response regulator [Planctomycetes bacterium]|nr:response regulator [Planctomycetota bacterium]
MAMKTILVADDEADSVAGVVLELKKRGFQIVETRTRSQAADALMRTVFDAVVLDLLLPEREAGDARKDPPLAKNGIALLEGIRRGVCAAHGTGDSVPVFVITGLGLEVKEVLARVKALSIEALFSKPLPCIRVAESISLCLQGKP